MSELLSQTIAFSANIRAPPDFKIKIGVYEWYIHSAVLVPHSSFFRNVCSNSWKESICGVIELHDDCPWTVAWMLAWCYSDDRENMFLSTYRYEAAKVMVHDMMYIDQGNETFDMDDGTAVPNQRAPWENNCLLYQLASKYDFPELLTIVRTELQTNLGGQPSLASGMAKSLGSIAFSNDEKLCEILMRAWFAQNANVGEIYAGVEVLFEGDLHASEAALKYIFKRLQVIQAANKRYRGSISSAVSALSELDEYVRRQRNAALKGKFKELRDILRSVNV